ncbi:MAG: ABC transporter ATP-binding protein [Nitrososphaerales archaeon]
MERQHLTLEKTEDAGNRTRPMVSASHVSMSYGAREVFSNLNLIINKGDFVALSGPVGSGKTTLIRLISGLAKPNTGIVKIDGIDLGSIDDQRLTSLRLLTVGVVHQAQNLVPDLTVRENVELPLFFLTMDQMARKVRVDHTLEKMGMTRYGDRSVIALSTGERQLTMLSRAMVTDPPILLLDEPTEPLDHSTRDLLLALLSGGNILAGKTLIVATHDKKVMDHANRSIRMKKEIL